MGKTLHEANQLNENRSWTEKKIKKTKIICEDLTVQGAATRIPIVMDLLMNSNGVGIQKIQSGTTTHHLFIPLPIRMEVGTGTHSLT